MRDFEPASTRLQVVIEWEKPHAARRVLAAARSMLGALIDLDPVGFAHADLVVRRKESPTTEIFRLRARADEVDGVKRRLEADLDDLSEDQFLAEWGAAASPGPVADQVDSPTAGSPTTLDP